MIAMLIDIHSHQCETQAGVFRMYATTQWKKPVKPDVCKGGMNGLSVGLHPWDADSWDEADANALLTTLSAPDVLLVGEIGLDKACEVPLSVQKSLFLFQLEVAARCGKPVLLHIVRAMSELLAIKKIMPNIPAWIIHGFRGGEKEAIQYLSKGFYLSFGQYHQQEAVKICPIDRLFLETDEFGNIHEVYKLVAAERKMRLSELESSMEENFKRVFPLEAWRFLL